MATTIVIGVYLCDQRRPGNQLLPILELLRHGPTDKVNVTDVIFRALEYQLHTRK